MSIEANTFERITIENANVMTKEIAKAFGEYLLKTWGIRTLDMDIDGCSYQTNEDTVETNEEFSDVCKRLGEAKNITISLRSENSGGLNWRLESCFLSMLTDDEDIRNYVTYKSTDYYDTDESLDLYSFGKNGVKKIEYGQNPEVISDIKEWYCYTHNIFFEAEEGFKEDIRSAILDKLHRLADEVKYPGSERDYVVDDEYEIYLEGALWFKTENIPKIAALLQQVVDTLKGFDDVSCDIIINAVPDGPNDYDFASVSFSLVDGQVQVGYCRF